MGDEQPPGAGAEDRQAIVDALAGVGLPFYAAALVGGAFGIVAMTGLRLVVVGVALLVACGPILLVGVLMERERRYFADVTRPLSPKRCEYLHPVFVTQGKLEAAEAAARVIAARRVARGGSP